MCEIMKTVNHINALFSAEAESHFFKVECMSELCLWSFQTPPSSTVQVKPQGRAAGSFPALFLCPAVGQSVCGISAVGLQVCSGGQSRVMTGTIVLSSLEPL